MKWISSCHRDIASKLENIIPCLHRGEHAWPTACHLCIKFYWSTANLRPYVLLVAAFTWQTLNWVDRDSLAWKAQNSCCLALFQEKFVLSLDLSLCKNASTYGRVWVWNNYSVLLSVTPQKSREFLIFDGV